jgi:hypothetical protein
MTGLVEPCVMYYHRHVPKETTAALNVEAKQELVAVAAR